MGYLIGLLLLCFLILFHEFGHFIVARRCGVGVEEFAVGMGPKVWSRRGKDGVLYSLRLFPVGGYCALHGEMVIDDDPTGFQNVSVWKRIAIVTAGPLFNLLLGLVLSVLMIGLHGNGYIRIAETEKEIASYVQEGDLLYAYQGHRIHNPLEFHFMTMDETDKDSGEKKNFSITVLRKGEPVTVEYSAVEIKKPIVGMRYGTDDDGNGFIYHLSEKNVLEDAGVREGDVITAVNGQTFTEDHTISDYLEEHPFAEEPVQLTLENAKGDSYTVEVTPFMETQYTDGLTYKTVYKRDGHLITGAFNEMYWNVKLTWKSLVGLVTGKYDVKDISGPVMVVKTLGDDYQSGKTAMVKDHESVFDAFASVAMMVILITVNLGVLNLLPIPALDGGHLIFYLVELVSGKRLNPVIEQKIHQVFLLIFLCLMLVIYIKDVMTIL